MLWKVLLEQEKSIEKMFSLVLREQFDNLLFLNFVEK